MVTFRDDFVGVGFYSDSQHPSAAVAYKFLMAIGQPHRVVFLECVRLKGTQTGVNYRNYQYDALRLVDHTAVPFVNQADIMIIPDMRFRELNVHGVGFPVSFSTFTRFHRQLASAARSQPSHTRSRTSTDAEVLALLHREFPWLSLQELEEILTKKSASESGGGGGHAVPSSGSAASVLVPDAIPEDILAAVSTELQDLRAQHGGFNEEGTFFTVKVLGGEWSMSRRGVPCTDVGAYAIERSTVLWCKAVGWPNAKSFAVKKHKGVENSRRLAEEMCRRGNFFMQAFIDAGSPGGFSFEAVKPSYASSRSFDEWFENLALNHPACKAAFEIRDLCPRAVPL